MNAKLAYQLQQHAHTQTQAEEADEEAFRCEIDILGLRNEISAIKEQLDQQWVNLFDHIRKIKYLHSPNIPEKVQQKLQLLENSKNAISRAVSELESIMKEIDAFLSPADDDPFEGSLIPAKPLAHVISPEFVENALQIFEDVADCIVESDEGSRIGVAEMDYSLTQDELQTLAERYETALIGAEIIMPFENFCRITQACKTLTIELL